MPSEKKRTGRPVKKAAPGSRVSLGLKVTAQIKDLLDAQAKVSGRTQSQEAEMMIERTIHYDRAFAAMKMTLEEIERGNLEAELQRKGYSFLRTEHGKVWLPPDYPGERSGFIPPKKSEE